MCVVRSVVKQCQNCQISTHTHTHKYTQAYITKHTKQKRISETRRPETGKEKTKDEWKKGKTHKKPALITNMTHSIQVKKREMYDKMQAKKKA